MGLWYNDGGRLESGLSDRRETEIMPTQEEWDEHNRLMRKLAGQKAARTRARRAKKADYPNPLSTAIVIHGREYIPYRQEAKGINR